MALNTVLLLPLILLQQVQGQSVVTQTVVEGISSYIDIICNLDRQFHPLYWRIQGRIYDLYNVPEMFTAISVEAITLGSVSRGMDGWTFQCFALDSTREGGLVNGVVNVLHGMSFWLATYVY